jgi:hypothetical protein
MSDAARTANTERAYLRRYKQLKSAVGAILGRKYTVAEFATTLIETVRPTLLAASWRQYRSAVCYGLERERIEHPERGVQVDAAVARLRTAPPVKCIQGALRTSQKKAKRLPVSDLMRIRQFALAGRSPHRQVLADFLLASDVTGLRPCEWPDAQLRSSSVPGFQWELVVVCAKATHGRSHGATRTLRFTTLQPGIVAAITSWLDIAGQADRADAYETLMGTLRSLMYRCCAKLFPRRKQRPTLYTPRHEASARWKAAYVEAAARPGRGERGSSGLPVPVADPDEVARVRRLFTSKLTKKASRETKPPKLRRS